MRAEIFISDVQRLLGDPNGQYHTTENMLAYLNMSLEDICTRSRTLCSWLYISVIDEQGYYGLPETFLEFRYVGFFYRGYLYPLNPGGTDDTAPAIFREHQYYNVPYNYSEGGNAALEYLLTTATEDSNDVGTGEIRFVLPTDLPPAVKVGDRFINSTDDFETTIASISVDRTIITLKTPLNGKTNTISEDDEFRILSRTEHLHSIAISPPPSKTDETGDESLYIYMARQHAPITQEHMDNQNDEIELAEEFNSTLRNRVMYYASLEDKGIDNAATIGFDVKYETDYMKTFPKAQKRIREYLSAWREGTHRLPNRRLITNLADWSVSPITVR